MKKKYNKLSNLQNKNLLEIVPTIKQGKKKSLPVKVLDAILTTINIAFYGAAAVFATGELSNLNSALKRTKSNQEVWKEAEILDADTDMIKWSTKGAVIDGETNKFTHNGADPIFYSFSNNIKQEDKNLYYQALNYYEEIFKDIDARYRFKEVSETEAYMRGTIGQSVIWFNEELLTETNLGYNTKRINMLKWDSIRDSKIVISTRISNQDQKLAVIVHEIAHTFGLGDGFHANSDQFQADTYMYSSSFNFEVGMLYPNDVKLLHVLYNKNITNNNGQPNNEEIKKINSLISVYENKFYEKVSNVIKNSEFGKNRKFENIDANKTNVNSFSFTYWYFNHETKLSEAGSYTYDFNFKTNTVSVKAYDKQNKLVYEIDENFFVKNGMIFIPSLSFAKGVYPQQKISNQNVAGDDFIVLFKADNSYSLFSGGSKNIISINPDFSLTANTSTKPKTNSKAEKNTFEM